MHEAEDNVHKGHRGRMRSKLKKHGRDIFDTYELLEMLLYHSVPYKDTNPIAKRLLKKFGDLDGVLRASAEELVGVSEIGERSAALISAVNEISEVLDCDAACAESCSFNSYVAVGEYFTRYFNEHPGERVAAMIFDNAMCLLDAFGFEAKLDSAAIKPRLFIDPVIRSGAAVIVTASTTLYPTLPLADGERASVKMIELAMQDIFVLHAEHYLVSGYSYFPAKQKPEVCKLVQTPQIDGFMDSLPKFDGEAES